jgi:hypothetical protein
MSYYVVRNKYTLPGFLFVAIASWVVVGAGLTILLLVNWGISSATHFDVIGSLHGPLRLLLNVSGAYGGLGGICLYVTMWVYWISVDRSSIWTRIGWLLALLLLLPYGALIYAVVVWARDVTKVDGPQPVYRASVPE